MLVKVSALGLKRSIVPVFVRFVDNGQRRNRLAMTILLLVLLAIAIDRSEPGVRTTH